MPKQIFGQLNIDFKNSIRLQKKKETYEIRKKLLKKNLRKRKLLNKVDQMTVLSDRWIKKMSKSTGMIKPFVDKQNRRGKVSFGLSSYGYDARVSNEFKIFTNVNSGVVDPKVFKKDSLPLLSFKTV